MQICISYVDSVDVLMYYLSLGYTYECNADKQIAVLTSPIADDNLN